MSERARKYYPKFWAKVQVGSPDECWPWMGYARRSGHGLTSLDNLMIHASRKAWILTNGPIEDGQCVNHKSLKVCAQQAICCNPDHMYLGTRADNMVDRWTNTSGDVRGLGRPYVLTHQEMERLWQMRREGHTLRSCAAEFGVSVSTICRYITAERKKRVARMRAGRLSAIA